MSDQWRPVDPRRSPANDIWPDDLSQAYHRMRAELDAVSEITVLVEGGDRDETRERVRDEHEVAMLERMDRGDYVL